MALSTVFRSLLWCTMQLHADSITVVARRLTFVRADQSDGTLEVTPSHLIMRLTTDIPLKSTVTEIGAREWLSTDSST
jgi:hypothetical protein